MAKKKRDIENMELPPETDPLDPVDESDVSAEEMELLEKTEYSMAGPEDQSWEEAKLDDKDEDGEPLNEKVEFSGDDLDLPVDEEEQSKDPIDEDEENDTYSLGGDRHDD